jgi:hypothetical protein
MITVSRATVAQRLGLQDFNESVLSVSLERLPFYLTYQGPWLAGGAVRRTMQGEKLDSDFDLFFNSEAQFELVKAKLQEQGNFVLTSSNDKNHTFKEAGYFNEIEGQKAVWIPEMVVQAIHFRYYDSPQDIVDSFDFTLSQFVYDGIDIHMGDFSLWDVARKKLVPNKITYGVSSLRRILKYANQGYTICAGGLGNILEQVVDNPEIINKETLYID